MENAEAIPKQTEISDVQKQKGERWNQLQKEFSQTGDRLGRGIDAGILDTVVAFNALGIHTRQSCEGHVDHGTGAPWIDVQASGTEALNQQVEEAFKRAQTEDTDDAWEEAHRIRKQLEAENLKEARKVFGLLQEFYTGREVPLDTRLILKSFGRGTARVESQGALFQETEEPETKQQKLIEYQQEMTNFTAFLKKKYFEE